MRENGAGSSAAVNFRGLGFRGLGFRSLGLRGLGFRGLGFRGLRFRASKPSTLALNDPRLKPKVWRHQRRLPSLNHRDPWGGRGEGGRGLYFLK